MNWYLRSRRFLAASYQWKREREARLQAEVRILETLLATTRQELADIRQLEGEKLALTFGSLATEEDGRREAKVFSAGLERLWMAGEHRRTA